MGLSYILKMIMHIMLSPGSGIWRVCSLYEDVSKTANLPMSNIQKLPFVASPREMDLTISMLREKPFPCLQINQFQFISPPS